MTSAPDPRTFRAMLKRLPVVLLLPLVTASVTPRPYSFPLLPTSRAPGASGEGVLDLAWSPFGLAVSPEGHVVYDLTLELSGLRALNGDGDAGYVVWIASRELDRIEKLGIVDGTMTVRAAISTWNKFMILVTVERDITTDEMRGALVLRGISPSGLMSSFQSHELFTDVPD